MPGGCHKPLSDEQVAQFLRDGDALPAKFFDAEEAEILRKTAKADAAFKQHAHLQGMAKGAPPSWCQEQSGRGHLRAVARRHRVVDAMEQLGAKSITTIPR